MLSEDDILDEVLTIFNEMEVRNLVLVETTFRCPRAADNEFPASFTCHGQLPMRTMKANKLVFVFVRVLESNAFY